MNPIFTEAQNDKIVQTALDSVFFQEFNQGEIPGLATARTASIFKQETFDRAFYNEQVYSGVPAFRKVGETQNTPAYSPRVTNTFTTAIATFAERMSVSKEMYDDIMHGVLPRTISEFAMKARIGQDINAFNLFNGGVSGATNPYLTADGVSFFNSAHPLIGGGTQSNYITGGGSALGTTALNNAVNALAVMKDQAGVVVGTTPSVLLVPPALFQLAKQLTGSVLVADGSTNAMNVYSGIYGLQVYQSPYLSAAQGGSDTRWFLLGRNHAVTRLIRQGAESAWTHWSLSDNRTYGYHVNFREEVKSADYISAIACEGV